MQIDDIHLEWATDSNIDIHHLDKSSLITAKLHSKYWKLLTNERLILYKYQSEYKKLKLAKLEYFSGSLTKEELTERGLKPWGKMIIKGDQEIYIEGDKEVINISLKIGYQKEKISLLESILQSIQNRGFQIKNAIDFMKMQNGSF